MTIFFFLLTAFDTALDYLIFNNYYDRRRWLSSVQILLSILISVFVANEIKALVYNAPVNAIVSVVLIVILCRLWFEEKLSRMIFVIAFYLFLWICLDLIVGVAVMNILQVRMDDILKIEYMRSLAFFIFVSIKFTIIQIIRRKRSHRRLVGEGRLYIVQLIVPFISCISMVYLIHSEVNTTEQRFMNVQLMMLVLSVINIIQYYVFDQINELQYANAENLKIAEAYKYKADYYSEVEKHQQAVRVIRHDLKNQLIALKVYINKASYGRAEDEIDIILDKVKSTEEKQFTANHVVNVLLNEKCETAKEKDIEFRVTVKIPEELNIEDREIVVLLGNLLDNCIEACEKVEGKRSITFDMQYVNGAAIIHAVNTTDGKVFNLQTRKDRSFEHGIGMRSMRSVAERYQGNLDLKIEDQMFVTDIILRDMGVKKNKNIG